MSATNQVLFVRTRPRFALLTKSSCINKELIYLPTYQLMFSLFDGLFQLLSFCWRLYIKTFPISS